MPPGDLFTFGPFTLDTKHKRLTKGSDAVALTGRQFDLLQLLVTRAGELLSKDALIEAAWPDVAVTDNSLEQAISSLRRTLSPPYIETQARRGYRFTADVTKVDRRESDEALEALLAPHRRWLEGRAALETLERSEILRARQVFESVLSQAAGQASAHVGLANACAMQFEMTRSDATPDVAALTEAMLHARESCRIDPQYAEAWATLGFVLERAGRHDDALAAARNAVALEPDNWRHRLRLGYTSWGEERLREARRTLALLPGCALAHWLAASVLVARQAFPEAERELNAGIDAQGAASVSRFSGVALYWLQGLVALADGRSDVARAHFERELSHEHSGHLYARECCANTWYAIGAMEWREGRRDEASRAFGEVLLRIPQHPLATMALAVVRGVSVPEAHAAEMAERLPPVDVALALAVRLVMARPLDGPAEAAALLGQAIGRAPGGSTGWLLPVEPLLQVATHPTLWAPILASLRHRAA